MTKALSLTVFAQILIVTDRMKNGQTDTNRLAAGAVAICPAGKKNYIILVHIQRIFYSDYVRNGILTPTLRPVGDLGCTQLAKQACSISLTEYYKRRNNTGVSSVCFVDEISRLVR